MVSGSSEEEGERLRTNIHQLKGNGRGARGATFVLSILSIVLLSHNTGSAAFAKDNGDAPDFIMDTRGIGHTNNGYVTSDQFLELGVPTSNGLRLEGENSLRVGDLDRALTVLQRSVEMAPLDMDGRLLYAEALEKKLAQKQHIDPVLFNFIVKQWLFIAKRSEFGDQIGTALSHLIDLTGTRPKHWESEKKFLARVMMPEGTMSSPKSAKLALKAKEAAEEEDTSTIPVTERSISDIISGKSMRSRSSDNSEE
jgi:hypothetical protein